MQIIKVTVEKAIVSAKDEYFVVEDNYLRKMKSEIKTVVKIYYTTESMHNFLCINYTDKINIAKFRRINKIRHDNDFKTLYPQDRKEAPQVGYLHHLRKLT
jgi:hypothetical protein